MSAHHVTTIFIGIIVTLALLSMLRDNSMLTNFYMKTFVSENVAKNGTFRFASFLTIAPSMATSPEYDGTETMARSVLPWQEGQLQSSKRKQERRLCSRAEIRDGAWIAANFSQPSYHPVHLERRCKADAAYWRSNATPPSSWPTYVWKPHSTDCELLTFEPAQFCSLVRNESLFLVGDSLMVEIFDSFVQQLMPIPIVYNETMPNPVVVSICGHDSNSKLILNRVYTMERPDEISRVLEDYQPAIVLMNQGAHYRRDDVFMRMVNESVSRVLQYKQQQGREHVRILWKTTPPGHPQCTKFDKPVNDMSVMKAVILNSSLYNFHPSARHVFWWEFAHQNDLVLKLLHSTGVEILDGYDLLLRRPDRHQGGRPKLSDCLHHCSPGPADVFPQLLSHYLHTTPDQVMDCEGVGTVLPLNHTQY